jgi:hypothetical protein
MKNGVNANTGVSAPKGVHANVHPKTNGVGLRYRLTNVVARAGETTTWKAQDTWLEQPVLLVIPEPTPSAKERFEHVASGVRAHASPHLVGLYDAGPPPSNFVVLPPPVGTLADERPPPDEEDVLVAGRSLGDAVAALHERDIVHGGLHPGMIVPGDGGELTLSPWPLAPEPSGWSSPGGFAGDTEGQSAPSVAGDVRSVGALLLGALAGRPLSSRQQVDEVRKELASRAPAAVRVVDKALTPPGQGGYWSAAELRHDCAAALAVEQLATVPVPVPVAAPELPASTELVPDVEGTPHVTPLFRPGRPGRPKRSVARLGAKNAADGADESSTDVPEGRRMAVAVAVAAALAAGAAATGALSGSTPSPAHHAAAARACETHQSCRAPSTAPAPGPAAAGTPTPPPAPQGGAATARVTHSAASASWADLPASGSTTTGAPAPLVAVTSTTPTTRPPVTSSSSTSAPTTTTTSTSSTTSTTSTTSSTTTTTTQPTTTTTATTQPPPTTTTTSGNGSLTNAPSGPGMDGSSNSGPSGSGGTTGSSGTSGSSGGG